MSMKNEVNIEKNTDTTMGLKYREDKHLCFLKDQDSEKLDVLVRILIYDKDGEQRYTEELSEESKYIRHKPNHQEYWDLITAEYQRFGGNSFMNFFRSKGVLYEEILTDVCDKMKVKFSKGDTVDEIEKNMLSRVMKDIFEEMSEKEREEFLRDLNIDTMDFSKQATLLALQTAIRSSGFMAYQFAVIIANTIAKQLLGHGLKFVANAGIVRAIGVLAGPVGLAVTGVWTVVDIAGSAYRVTIPATIYIAALRQAELHKDTFEMRCPSCEAIIIDRSSETCKECGEEYK